MIIPAQTQAQIWTQVQTPIHLTCTACGQSTAVQTSKLDRKAKREELNTTAILAIRSVGCGHSGLRKFCGVMDLPPPLSPSNYQKHAKAIHDAAKQEAEESMNLAVKSLRTQAHRESEILDVSISCDGTWARREFTSLHGVVVVASLETGQILDCEVISKTCYACKRKAATKPDLKSSEFQLWYESHLNECQANFEGSSPAMESAGTEVIWGRSLHKYNCRYTTLLGDGNAKTLQRLIEVKPNGEGCTISKLECVGHVQKRLGKRRRDVKVSMKGKNSLMAR